MLIDSKISEELRHLREIIGFSQQEMAYLLDMDYQSYKLWEKGKWDGSYSKIKTDIKVRLLRFEEEFDSRIQRLKEAREKYIRYRSNGMGTKNSGKHNKTRKKFHPNNKRPKSINTKSVVKLNSN